MKKSTLNSSHKDWLKVRNSIKSNRSQPIIACTELVRNCQNMSKHVKTCQNMSKYVNLESFFSGFQLILLTREQEDSINSSVAQMASAPSTPVAPSSSTRSFTAKLKLRKNVSLTPIKKTSIVLPQVNQSPARDVWLSIGRIFHR